MAFKSTVTPNIGTVSTTVHTGAATLTTTVIGLSVSNVSLLPILVDITLTKAVGGAIGHIIKQVSIPVGDSFVSIGGIQKVVMEAGDTINVVSSAVTSADVIFSYLEG